MCDAGHDDTLTSIRPRPQRVALLHSVLDPALRSVWCAAQGGSRMKWSWLLLVGAMCIVASGCGEETVAPPVAKVVPYSLEAHGDLRIDDYYWLQERSDPEVIAYLEAENNYTEEVMASSAELRETLFEEIKGRIKQDDDTVPYPYRGSHYYTRFVEGQDYPIHCRRVGNLEAAEEVMLDVNQVAAGHEFCAVSGQRISPGGGVLAYPVDLVGRRKYTIRFRELGSGRDLPDALEEVTDNLVWANDDRTVFYVKQDPVTLRAFQVYRHLLGSDPARDELVYQEEDDTFSVSLRKTRSERFILVESEQTLSTEVRALDADLPDSELLLIQPRERDLEYHVAHQGDKWLIRTNLDAVNFRLVEAPVDDPGRENWRELVGNRDDVFLSRVDAFADHLVVTERRDGLRRLRILPVDGSEPYEITFDHPAPVVWVHTNRVYDTPVLRFGLESLNVPESVYAFDTKTREQTLLKQKKVLGGFDENGYIVERLAAPARDGVEVPISLVYRRGLVTDGSNPLLLYAYGSYGLSTDPWFKPEVISLLDRGFVYAIAHVRGGQELGRWWYENGKLLHKKNTFTDFIDCARYLAEEGYTAPGKVFAQGGSAGGLLMGAVANMAPEIFAGIIARVPWMDVVTCMLDHSIPLTTSEFDEWGNPEQREYYDYMLSYSPYDNVRAMAYPNILVTAGLHDSQVQYWEAAKWVAKLRATKTDDNLLLLKTDMNSGHGGPSGRSEGYEETALVYAFILQALEG